MSRRSFTALLIVPVLSFAASPARAAVGDLIDVVPEGAYSVWHRMATPDTALVDGYFYEVVDAVLAARFDQVVLDVMASAGAPEETVAGITTVRNAVASMLGSVPWRDMVQQEFVVAESMDPPFVRQFSMPSYLFACKPESERVPVLVDALTGLLGSLVAIVGPDVSYDVSPHAGLDGRSTDVHTVTIPQQDDLTVLQMAFTDEHILVGCGAEFFGRALDLASGGEGRPLARTERWSAAFTGLPSDASGRVFLDYRQMMDGIQGLTTMLAQREHDAGRWMRILDEAFGLFGFVDTVGMTSTCRGNQIVTETLTRFDPASAPANPLHRSGIAQPYSGELLDYVPADVVAFETRGAVDLAPMYQFALDRLRSYWPQAEDALWAFDVLQAAVDLSVEDDLLSWLGSEHVSMEIPSQRRHAADGATDSVTLSLLRDPGAARKCLDRLTAVFQAAVPRLMGKLHAVLEQTGVPIIPNLHLRRSTGIFSMLHELELTVGNFPVPKLTFGVLGNLLVVTTSEEALDHCLAVAAGDFDNLGERPTVAGLLEGGAYTSASLRPVGLRMAQATQAVAGFGGIMQGVLSAVSMNNDPRVSQAVSVVSGILPKITDVMSKVDFLGDQVRFSESRDGGLASYECATQYILSPEQRPSYMASAR